jgi:hypothetical protein
VLISIHNSQRNCLCCVMEPFLCPMINEHYSMTRVEYQTDVELHFAAIPTDSKIDVSTIHQILGVGAQNCETIDEAPYHYKQCLAHRTKGGREGDPRGKREETEGF